MVEITRGLVFGIILWILFRYGSRSGQQQVVITEAAVGVV